MCGNEHLSSDSLRASEICHFANNIRYAESKFSILFWKKCIFSTNGIRKVQTSHTVLEKMYLRQYIIKSWSRFYWKMLPSNYNMKQNRLDLMLLLMIYSFIVYYGIRDKEVYFASVMSNDRAKRGQQSYELNKCFFRVAHVFFFHWGVKKWNFLPPGVQESALFDPLVEKYIFCNTTRILHYAYRILFTKWQIPDGPKECAGKCSFPHTFLRLPKICHFAKNIRYAMYKLLVQCWKKCI